LRRGQFEACVAELETPAQVYAVGYPGLAASRPTAALIGQLGIDRAAVRERLAHQRGR